MYRVEGGIRSHPFLVAGSAKESPVWIGLRSPLPAEFLMDDASIFPGKERNRSICRPDQRVNSGECLLNESSDTSAAERKPYKQTSLCQQPARNSFVLTWPPPVWTVHKRRWRGLVYYCHISRTEDKINATRLYLYICPTRKWGFSPFRITETKLQTICQKLHLVRPEPTSFEL